MIDPHTEQRIKETADIIDIVSDFLELRKKGVNYETLCPFHNDRHLGSFVISPRHNCYKCFSCDAKGGPVDFLMNYAHMDYPDALRYIAAKYGIQIPGEEPKKIARTAKPRNIADRIPADLPPRMWPISWVGYYTNLDEDNLVSWLRSISWDSAQRANLERNLKDYAVGHAGIDWKGERHEFTVFWQIDENNQLHNGHLMKYLRNGHRDKNSDYSQTWLHARMRYAQNHPLRFDDRQYAASYCLFGQNLLNAYPHATINLVESEKTALIMATAYGNHDTQIWMACGGLQNLNADRLAPLMKQGRKIVLYPDRDGIEAWTNKAYELSYPAVSINTRAVRDLWKPSDGAKADVADVILRFINKHHIKQPLSITELLEDVMKRRPKLRKFVEQNKLKVANE
ncbi:MAG: hypothetical protein IIZ78_27535 [Clostridiales bacterium]|nr:hypothetical protein [Clostridiales bacterium]